MGNDAETTKVLVLLGSPRKKGNSAVLANQIIEGAQSTGAEVETVYLNGKKIRACQGCYVCQKPDSKGCAQQDDMQEIYPKLLEANAWVIATPVYWFNMTAQTKLFMDRMFALSAYTDARNAFENKRIAIAMTYGDTDPFRSGCTNALRSFQDSFSYTRSKIVGMVYGSADALGAIKDNTALLDEARKLGRKVARTAAS